MTAPKPMTGQPQKDLGSSGSVASSGPDSQCPTAVADQEREAFELAILSEGYARHSLNRNADGAYVWRDMESFWQGWQARAAWPDELRVHGDGEECEVGNCSRSHYSIPNPDYRAAAQAAPKPEREARASAVVGDERNGRKEAAPRAEQAEGWVLVPREPTEEILKGWGRGVVGPKRD